MSYETIPEVCKDPHVRLPSTWRDAVGAPLTSKRIAYYQREGFYGEGVQRMARDRYASKHIVHRCKCGTQDNVRFLKWSYLPRPGYWCPRCVAFYRGERDKDKEEQRELAARVMCEYS